MRPLTVITGVLLGSCFSIAFSLAAVLFVFQVLKHDYPRVNHEFGALLASLAVFTAMTAICGVSFYALVKEHRFRWLAQLFMWLGLIATAIYYWP